jgi:uncharacterized membrane protein
VKLTDDGDQLKSDKVNRKRIETLVDGIFAIAMTLLVLGISVPNLTNPTEATILKSLIDLIPNFYSYFLSFILLAIFWRINHTQFNQIKRADGTTLWIMVLWLLFVALVPFSAFLLGEYGSFQVPNIFFDLNLFAIGFFLFLNWRHAINSGLLGEIGIKRVKQSNRVNLILPIISLMALALTFLPFIKVHGYGWTNLVYMIIPFLKRFNDYLID